LTHCRFIRFACLLPTVLAASCAARAHAQAPPVVSRIEPLGIPPGAATNVTVHGSGLKGATQLWTTAGAEGELSPDLEKNGEEDGRAVFRITLPEGTPPGPQALRIAGPGGVSRLELFLVDELATHSAAPQDPPLLELPCAVEGVVAALSTHVCRFHAARGQEISFDVFARRLGSPLDPLIVLVSESTGREVASADDTPGLGGDCQLRHHFEEDGVYALRLRDIGYAGGGQHIYRLRMGDFPCVQSSLPMAVQRGEAAQALAAGVVSEGVEPRTVTASSEDAAAINVGAGNGAGASAFVTLLVTDGAEVLEQESNDSQETANPLELGASVNGRFSTAGDIDWHRFSAKKGDRWLFSGMTRSEGAPTDLQFRIVDAEGKQLAAVDDQGIAEGEIDQTFPADGDYFLAAEHLHPRGGEQYVYRIETRAREPGFSLAVESDVLNVPAGGVGVVSVSAARRDYAGAIDLQVEGLPEGLVAQPVRIGPGLSSGVLTVTAAADAPAGAVHPVRIVGTAAIGARQVREVAAATDSLRAHWNNLPVVPPQVRRSAAVGVAPAKPLALTIEPAEVVFGRELTATVKVTAQRGEGIDEAITLATRPDKNALPGEVALELKPIPKGELSVELKFTATEKAPLGPFSVVLDAVHKKGDATVAASTPAINFRLDPPLNVVAEAVEPLAKGKSTTLKIKLQRNPAFAAPVKVSLVDPPQGITADELLIPADQSEGDLVVKASAEAAVGAVPALKLRAASASNEKHAAETTVSSLEVKAE
jgi:hypothetical protein